MGAFGRCGGGGRRLAARAKAPVSAVYTTVTRSHSAILVDISTTGARLRGAVLPQENKELLLTAEGLQVFGTVMWSHDGECGVRFDLPIPADEVQSLREKVAKGAGLDPEVKAAFEEWICGAAR